MLAKQNRLRLKRDFEKVFKQGKGFRQNFLFLKMMENDLSETRFGFIVSKKISNKAVIRNKIRRQLREIVRNQLSQIKKGLDIVLVVLPEIKNKEFQEIEQTVNELFKKARIMKLET